MLDTIKLRLQCLGYEVVNGDDFALNFIIKKVEQHIKHFCNISEIPDCLECAMVDMCVSEFMISKKTTGQLTSLQLEQSLKSIEDGDTTVSFQSGMDADTRFISYFENLGKKHEMALIRHRKLVW